MAAPVRRQYPHISEVADQAVAKSLRLLWDKVYSHDTDLATTQQIGVVQNQTLAALTKRNAGTAGTAGAVVGSGGGGGGGGGDASAIDQLTGDVTATGPGIVPATLAASGVAPATYGDGSHVAQVAVDAKGRVTSAANVPIGAGSCYVPISTGSEPLVIVSNGAGVIVLTPYTPPVFP